MTTFSRWLRWLLLGRPATEPKWVPSWSVTIVSSAPDTMELRLARSIVLTRDARSWTVTVNVPYTQRSMR